MQLFHPVVTHFEDLFSSKPGEPEFTATHQAEFLGVAPTGKKIEMSYLAMVKSLMAKVWSTGLALTYHD